MTGEKLNLNHMISEILLKLRQKCRASWCFWGRDQTPKEFPFDVIIAKKRTLVERWPLLKRPHVFIFFFAICPHQASNHSGISLLLCWDHRRQLKKVPRRARDVKSALPRTQKREIARAISRKHYIGGAWTKNNSQRTSHAQKGGVAMCEIARGGI